MNANGGKGENVPLPVDKISANVVESEFDVNSVSVENTTTTNTMFNPFGHILNENDNQFPHVIIY